MVLVVDVGRFPNPIQKSRRLNFFRHRNSSRAKSAPIVFPRYMRRAAETNIGFWLPLISKPATCGRHSCRWATNWRLPAPRAGSLLGLSSCWAIPRRLIAPPGRPSAQRRLSRLLLRAGAPSWYHTCKLCYPGSGWRRQLCPARYPGHSQLLALGWAGESLYSEAVPLALRPFFASNTRSPAHHHERAPYGVCGLLALPKHSPDLWGQSC